MENNQINNEEKKAGKGLKIFALIILLVIIGLLGYLTYVKFIKKDNSNNNTNTSTVEKKKDSKKDNTKENKNTKKLIKKTKEDKAYIYDREDYTNSKIPYINIDTEDAKKINEEIKEFVDKYQEDNFSIFYNYYTNDDTISLVMFVKNYVSSDRVYRTYNFSIVTGKKISNSDLLKDKKIKDDLGTVMLEIYEKENEESMEAHKKFKTSLTSGENEGELITVYEANKTTLTTTKLEDFNIYLNEKNEVCVAYEEFNIAGAWKSYKIYNIDKKSYEK